MTVAQLIALLQQLPQDLQVGFEQADVSSTSKLGVENIKISTYPNYDYTDEITCLTFDWGHSNPSIEEWLAAGKDMSKVRTPHERWHDAVIGKDD